MFYRARSKLEKGYEQLLTTNESLLEELTRAVQHKKNLECEREEVLKANEELFQESERLTQEETKWQQEKLELQAKISEITILAENLQQKLKEKDLNDERDVELASLRRDKSELVGFVGGLQAENERLLREMERASEANSDLKKMRSHLEVAAAKCKALEKENKQLRSAAAGKDEMSQLSDLVEKNKALTEWRRQLVEKNQTLVRIYRTKFDSLNNFSEIYVLKIFLFGKTKTL